ncbi:hypothetical protein EON67_09445 [archaeon]|nr:MAG: hypothetical protein EON67_09445 [archaeon]
MSSLHHKVRRSLACARMCIRSRISTHARVCPFLRSIAGFVVALVNFRGSLGYGEAATACLAGRIGELDVADVHAATLAACALGGDEAAACELRGLYPGHVYEAHVAPNLVPALPLRVSQARVGIMGGSHGGYLTAHAIGRFPKLYRAACLRNPVIDVASMIGSTDIADWCATEALGCDTYHAYTQGTLPYPTPDMLAHMHATSPIATVHAVEAAVLVMLGLKDKRVPAFQGLQYYNLLRARRVTTRCVLFAAPYRKRIHDAHSPRLCFACRVGARTCDACGWGVLLNTADCLRTRRTATQLTSLLQKQTHG